MQVPSFSLSASMALTCDSFTLLTYTFMVSPTLLWRRIAWMVLSYYLARAEEVGRGGGPLSGGKIGSTLMGLAERSAGRVLPAATNLSSPYLRGASAGTISLSKLLGLE